MKNIKVVFVLALLTSLFNSPLAAQKTTHWKGGTPGRETDWFCASNWSGGTVPNSFSDVVLSDASTGSRVYPLIGKGAVEVNSLLLDGLATLQIAPEAWLVVLGDCHAVQPKNIFVQGFFQVIGEHEGLPQSEVASL